MKKDDRSDAEWRSKLTPEQYRTLREGGTEPSSRASFRTDFVRRASCERCEACCAASTMRSERPVASRAGVSVVAAIGAISNENGLSRPDDQYRAGRPRQDTLGDAAK